MGIGRHPLAQRLGRRLGHLGKSVMGALLDLVLPVPADVGLKSVRDVNRVLLVRPNFRIGNTLITTPLVLALQARFPKARIDYLAGDTTARLLAHLSLGTVYCVSRRQIARPWQFVALFVRLRRERYDVAVEGGMGSFSGGLYTYFTGARFRIGCEGKGDRFLNVRLPPVRVDHVYDSPAEFARLLGVSCPAHPVYAVSDDERAAARAILRGLDLEAPEGVPPFAALFVGGHLDKRWPVESWLDLATALQRANVAFILFLGPEEAHLEGRFRSELTAARVLRPQPLRVFAALWEAARVIVTPDSGPLHLAAALGVPTVAILRSEHSLIYRPRRDHDRVLMRPTAAEVKAALEAHPIWGELRAKSQKSNE